MVTSIFAAITHNMRGWSFYVVICLPHSNRQSSTLKHHDTVVGISESDNTVNGNREMIAGR